MSGVDAIRSGAGGDAHDPSPGPVPRSRRPAPAIWQPRQPVFWLYLALTVPCIVIVVSGVAARADSLAGLLAAVVLVGAQGVLIWLIVRAVPRFRRQPRSLLIAALVWGGAVGIGLAGELNSMNIDALRAFGLDSFGASISAPLNEDLLRFLGVLVVLVLAYRRPLTVMDGVVYGFLVGAGFELVENLLYAVGGEPGETLRIGFGRLFIGFALHALWSASSGAVLAYCLSRAQRGLGGRWLLLAPAIVLPMLLHAGWDSPSFTALQVMRLLVLALLYALTLVLFFAAIAWGRRSEFAWFADRTGSALTRAGFRRLPRAERRALAREAVVDERSR